MTKVVYKPIAKPDLENKNFYCIPNSNNYYPYQVSFLIAPWRETSLQETTDILKICKTMKRRQKQMRYTKGLYAIYREYCEGDCPKIIRFPTYTLTRNQILLTYLNLLFFNIAKQQYGYWGESSVDWFFFLVLQIGSLGLFSRWFQSNFTQYSCTAVISLHIGKYWTQWSGVQQPSLLGMGGGVKWATIVFLTLGKYLNSNTKLGFCIEVPVTITTIPRSLSDSFSAELINTNSF